MREKRTQRPAAQQPAQRTSAAPAERPAEGTRSKKKSQKKGHWFGRFLLGLIKFCFAMACLGIMAVSVVAVGISSYLAKTTVNDEAELLAIAKEVMSRDDLKHCPHGRPICITLSKKQLEKQFKRT